VSLKKSELKLVILAELGQQAEDQKAALGRVADQLGGAAAALHKASADLQTLHAHADAELESGKIPDLETLKSVKLYVTRGMEMLALKANSLEAQEIRQRGRVDQAAAHVAYLQKCHKAETDRLQALLDSVNAGRVTVEDGELVMAQDVPPMGGVRPNTSIAQQRKTEESAATIKKKPAAKKKRSTKKATSKKK